MPMNVKPGYVNPLTMMNQKKDELKSPLARQGESKDKDVQDLQTKKQTLQNQMLILKSTSDGAAMSGELQNNLEKELEEITAELKTAKSMVTGNLKESSDISRERARFDSYEPEKPMESPGLYEVKKDADNGYKILLSPYEQA